MATELHISTGVEELVLNGKVHISINLTDASFAKLLFTRFSALEEKDRAWRERMKALHDPKTVMEEWDKGDRMFREAIDGVLGEGTCEALIGSTSVRALAEGLPIWANILLAIIEQMDNALTRQEKTVNPKLQKYLNKYHK